MDLGLSYPTLIPQQLGPGLSRPEGTRSKTETSVINVVWWCAAFNPVYSFGPCSETTKKKKFKIHTFLAWLSPCNVSSLDQPHLLLVLSQQDWKSSTDMKKHTYIWGEKYQKEPTNTISTMMNPQPRQWLTHTPLHVTHVTQHTDLTPNMREWSFFLRCFQRH